MDILPFDAVSIMKNIFYCVVRSRSILLQTKHRRHGQVQRYLWMTPPHQTQPAFASTARQSRISGVLIQLQDLRPSINPS
jgi:hypothetical protein